MKTSLEQSKARTPPEGSNPRKESWRAQNKLIKQ